MDKGLGMLTQTHYLCTFSDSEIKAGKRAVGILDLIF